LACGNRDVEDCEVTGLVVLRDLLHTTSPERFVG
jgi:hypothetical protein